MRILVTGGAGFIGRHLTQALQRAGHEVSILDVLDRTVVNTDAYVPAQCGVSAFHRGDVCSEHDLAGAMDGVDTVIHAAAQSSVDRAIRDPREAFVVNTLGTVSTLRAACESGVRRVHFVNTIEAASRAVGSSDSWPRNPYSASKLAAESACRAWTNTYGLEITVTNASNNFGPYQAPSKLLPVLAVKALRGERLPLYGDGGQARDWLHVEDHCRGIIRVALEAEAGVSETLASGVSMTNHDVAGIVLHELGLPHDRITYVDDRPGHDRGYVIGSSCLAQDGEREQTSAVKRGMRETVRWYRDNPEWWSWFSRNATT